MNGLTQLTIDAHGGMERLQRFEYVSAHVRTGGVLWTLKRQQGVLDDVTVRVALHKEWASHAPVVEPNLRTSVEPQRVATETNERRVVAERRYPRESFAGHGMDTPWDRLHLAYFAGDAMWTYLTSPFLLTMDGVSSEELSPWHEDGETWRRLKVTFPPDIATHSTVQTFSIGSDGLLKRHDYNVEISGDSPAAHYVHDHQETSGFSFRRSAECFAGGRTERQCVTRFS